MKELVLFVDGQSIGPFPSEEVEKRLAAGEFSAETPCAEPGATEWKPLGEVLSASAPVSRPTVVRIARKTQEEADEMKTATSEKLDPDVRKKLLLYNLADAISVDKFTPVQADAAIKIHEEALKKGKNLKIAAGVGGFLVSFALASLLFTGVNFGTAPGGKGQKLFEKIFEKPENPEHKKMRQRIASEAERLNQLREEVAGVKFGAPRSQGDPRQTFLGNVEIKNPDVSTVTGTLDISALPAGLTASTKFEVIQLKRLDGSTEERIKKQNELFAILSTPIWTDADLRKAIAEELAKDFPKSDAPEAAEIASRLKMFRLDGIESQLQWLEKRVAEIGQLKEIQGRAKEKSSSRKKNQAKKDEAAEQRKAASREAQNWASREMPKFLGKLKTFLEEKEIYYSAEKRAEAWREFSENDLAEIQNKITENEMQRTLVGSSGEFILDGRSDRNLIAVAHFERAGDVYFVPAKDDASQSPVRIQNLSVNRRTLKPEDVLMEERYVVSAKEKTGGIPLATSGKILSQEIFIVRTSPEWFYITVEKKLEEGETSRRRSGVILGVPAEFYESVAVGDEVPMEKLLTFERFGKVSESPVTGRLVPIAEDKLEAVKEQQTDAGIVFPPPPEKYVPPAPTPEVSEPVSEAEPAVPAEETSQAESTPAEVPADAGDVAAEAAEEE